MELETYCGVYNIGLNSVSKNTVHRIYAITDRNI